MDGSGFDAAGASAASPDVNYAQEKEAMRRKAFKATIDQEDSRRRREENQIKIRKEKKMTQLAKRRMVCGSAPLTPTHRVRLCVCVCYVLLRRVVAAAALRARGVRCGPGLVVSLRCPLCHASHWLSPWSALPCCVQASRGHVAAAAPSDGAAAGADPAMLAQVRLLPRA